MLSYCSSYLNILYQNVSDKSIGNQELLFAVNYTRSLRCELEQSEHLLVRVHIRGLTWGDLHCTNPQSPPHQYLNPAYRKYIFGTGMFVDIMHAIGFIYNRKLEYM